MTSQADFAAHIARAAAAYRVRVPEEAVEPLARYLEAVHRWNRAVSLTSIRDPEELALRFAVEPAAALPALAGAGPRMLDAGSGAGCPGIPLKILEPDRETFLLEANGRKAAFLHDTVETLELDRTTVVEGRLEELVAAEEAPEGIHLLTARAWTSGWGLLLGQAAEIMVPRGRALLLVGEEAWREIRRNLARGTESARHADRDWAAAAAAEWRIRKAAGLPHLDRGYAVTLELPGY